MEGEIAVGSICIDLQNVLSLSEKVGGESTKISRCESAVQSVRSGTDRRILARRNLSSRLSQAQSALDALERKVADIGRVMGYASNQYRQTDTRLANEAKEFHNPRLSSCAIAGSNAQAFKEAVPDEKESRKKTAGIIKWAAIGVSVVASAALIIGTGGAAAPLVIGAVSAASGALVAGTSNLADQYVEHGNLIENHEDIDWGDFGKDVFIGSATGFVTGWAGASVSGAVTSAMGNTAVGSTLLNSSSALTRVTTGAAIGSVSEVGSGIVSRGAATAVEGVLEGDFNGERVLDEMFDGKSMLLDAAIGGVSGGKKAKNAVVGKEVSIDDFKNNPEIEATKPRNSPDAEKWIGKGGKIYTDGNGTWTYVNNEDINVVYTDDYPDFKRAGLVEKTADIGGFSDSRQKDFSAAEKLVGKKPANTTWHHSEDGRTLEAVSTKYHKQFTHCGGFSLVNSGG